MKTRPSLLRLFAGFLFLCAGLSVRAETETFEIRAAAPFSTQSLTMSESGGTWGSWMLGSFSFEQSWNGSQWDAHALLTNVGIDPDNGAWQ
jgi:hypothetical protein